MAKVDVATGEHNFEVVGIARVEGEGTLKLRITDGEVREAREDVGAVLLGHRADEGEPEAPEYDQQVHRDRDAGDR